MLNKIKKYFRERKLEVIKPFSEEGKRSRVRFILCGNNPEITSAFNEFFHEVPHVQIILGDIFNIEADAIVSPANSFGDMSGGLDKAIDNFYLGKAQKEIMQLIQKKHYGELPVGNAEIISLGTENFPYMICAPTMRIPGTLEKASINAYLAMRAVLIELKKYNSHNSDYPIKTIAIPSFCTGVGGLHYKQSAEQMFTAFTMIEATKYKEAIHPALAPYNHKEN